MKAPSLYARYALPVLVDLAMRNKTARTERARFVPLARGVVLEVGVGSGLNLPYYGSSVQTLYALDPSAELLRKAEGSSRRARFPVIPLRHRAESIPLADASIDTVVMTWTLCSIDEPLAALGEIRRVLTVDGELIFVEHGRAAEPGVVRWQDRLTPIWKRFTGGCHLNRAVETLLAQAGFITPHIEKGYVPGPRIGSFYYRGIAHSSPSAPAVRTQGDRHGP